MTEEGKWRGDDVSSVQLDLFKIDESEEKDERLKIRAKEVYDAIRKIDPNINVVAIFCDIVHSFIVQEGDVFKLYIFDDREKLDSFRFDNWTFRGIPKNFIMIRKKEEGD